MIVATAMRVLDIQQINAGYFGYEDYNYINRRSIFYYDFYIHGISV